MREREEKPLMGFSPLSVFSNSTFLTSWPPAAKKRPAVAAFRVIGTWIVGQFQQIIHTGVIKPGQCAENLRRQHPLAAFIVGIGPLRDTHRLPQLFLGKVVVLSQVPDSSVHCHHPDSAYVRTKYSIYILNKLFYNRGEVIICHTRNCTYSFLPP